MLSESELSSVSVAKLDINDATQLMALLSTLNWPSAITDATGASVVGPLAGAGMPPFMACFDKPTLSEGIAFVGTSAFEGWMKDAPSAVGIVHIAALESAFETYGFRVCSWDDQAPGHVATMTKPTDSLVRSFGSSDALPKDIRPFLLRPQVEVVRHEQAYLSWESVSMQVLIKALASEIFTEKISFIGPPRVDFSTNTQDSVIALTSNAFVHLQEASRWVYELEREAEVRHAFFVHEFSRIADEADDVVKAFEKYCFKALEGAKIAYQYGVADQSKDALKSLSDLRKAVIDETSKSTENARQLSLSAAGALFYGLGLIAAKITSSIPSILLDAMALLGAGYTAVIIYTNKSFLDQQAALRNTWKDKLYKYLSPTDYGELVADPIRTSEQSVKVLLWVVGILAAAVFTSVIVMNHRS